MSYEVWTVHPETGKKLNKIKSSDSQREIRDFLNDNVGKCGGNGLTVDKVYY